MNRFEACRGELVRFEQRLPEVVGIPGQIVALCAQASACAYPVPVAAYTPYLPYLHQPHTQAGQA